MPPALTTVAPTPPVRVRFNGASMQLEPVSLPVPSKAPTNPQSMPLPKVTVSTSSGARLQPPPRVPTADCGAGSSVDLASRVEELALDEGPRTKEGEEEHKEVSEPSDASWSAVQSPVVSGAQQVAAQMLVGSVQLSEDGAAMLFSTG